jgi:hypothetical protein
MVDGSNEALQQILDKPYFPVFFWVHILQKCYKLNLKAQKQGVEC